MSEQGLFPPSMQMASRGSAHDAGAQAGGVPDSFFVELILRHLYRLGERKLFAVSELMGMSANSIDTLLAHMRGLQWVEVTRRGEFEGDVTYALTDAGQRQARLAFEKCQYVGPAPVTLDEYTHQVRLQSEHLSPVKAAQLAQAMDDLVVDEAMLPALGSAMNSGKAMYLFGDSGTGKTYLAEHLVKTLEGNIWVPHAIFLNGEVIQVFDPVVHHAVETPASERGLVRDLASDGRWVQTRRPVVIAGGELTLDALELEYDSHSRMHVAPPQLKANNGIFVIDDLGRQRVSARELMNRWIVPLDRRVDYLSLHTGGKFVVPFDVKVIFLSNLAPEELVDPAFARRMGYKIHIQPLEASGYRTVIGQACARSGVPPDPASIDFLVNALHPRHGQPYLPCVPFDVISKIADRSRYLDQPAAMTPELVEWAWAMYFGSPDRPPQVHSRTQAT